MLTRYNPMLATPWPAAFGDPDWWFEVKWDGFRVIVEWDGFLVLRSRRGNVFTASFPELEEIRFDRPTVVDGELVAFGDDGTPDFTRLLQRNGVTGRAARRLTASAPVTLVAFDLLHHGEPLVSKPIEERRRRLSDLEAPWWTASEMIPEEGEALFAAVHERGLEGVVAKRRESIYRPGVRSPDWRKIANRRFARVVVVGYSPGERGRSDTFGALQMAVYDDARLRYVGGVGSGFDDSSLRAIRSALGEMVSAEPPLIDSTAVPPGTTWVAPKLVALVEYKDWTPEGRLRAPVFKGFVDVDPAAVTWDAEWA